MVIVGGRRSDDDECTVKVEVQKALGINSKQKSESCSLLCCVFKLSFLQHIYKLVKA